MIELMLIAALAIIAIAQYRLYTLIAKRDETMARIEKRLEFIGHNLYVGNSRLSKINDSLEPITNGEMDGFKSEAEDAFQRIRDNFDTLREAKRSAEDAEKFPAFWEPRKKASDY